ncbi:hypothetical protein A2U01_0032469 [Trifolium medium]|uniref:Uncharacterized protein n=1 Tax=Trifolium medium TaxID=97028 RepID=A0A392PIQ3_9FABA|nr:hypothetical protein [Trifolium medium]
MWFSKSSYSSDDDDNGGDRMRQGERVSVNGDGGGRRGDNGSCGKRGDGSGGGCGVENGRKDRNRWW